VQPSTPTRPDSPNDAGARSDAVATVAVWDVPVRVVHWTLVVLIVALIVTGKLGADWLEWHMRFGESLLALIAFRILWGFVGSRNARFATFVFSPARVARYARSIAQRAKETYVSHNPLGGWMVLALLVALLAQATAGLFANDDVLWEGPLAARVTKDTSDAFSWFHRRFWWVIVALSTVHIGAAIAYLAAWKDNLIVPMLTGRKTMPVGAADPAHAAASLVKAAVLLVVCGLAVWYGVTRLAPVAQ
jgi:cytochrome b